MRRSRNNTLCCFFLIFCLAGAYNPVKTYAPFNGRFVSLMQLIININYTVQYFCAGLLLVFLPDRIMISYAWLVWFNLFQEFNHLFNHTITFQF